MIQKAGPASAQQTPPAAMPATIREIATIWYARSVTVAH